MKRFLRLAFAPALLLAVAYAQTSGTTPTSTGQASPATSTTTTNEARGTITEFSPGVSLVLKTGAGESLHFRFGKTVTYINDEGRSIEPARIKKNFIARVHYTKEGNDMVIDKLILSD
jgi:hypothetical protein